MKLSVTTAYATPKEAKARLMGLHGTANLRRRQSLGINACCFPLWLPELLEMYFIFVAASFLMPPKQWFDIVVCSE